MAADSNSQEVTKWKNKYFDNLDRLEKKEKDWAQSEQLFKKALNRISIIAEGENPLIDHHLQALRSVLKDQISAYRLESVLNELFEVVAKLDSKTDKKTKKTSQSELVRQIVEQLVLPAQYKQTKKAFLKSLPTDSELDTTQVSSFVSLVNEAIKQETSPDKESKGLLGRLFSKQDESESEPQVLIQLAKLLENLPWPDELVKSVQQTTSKIRGASDVDKLVDAIIALQQLVNQWPQATTEVHTVNESSRIAETQNVSEFLQSLHRALHINDEFDQRLKSLKDQIEQAAEGDVSSYANNLAAIINQQLATQKAPTSESDQMVRQRHVNELIDKLGEYARDRQSIERLRPASENGDYLDRLASRLATLIDAGGELQPMPSTSQNQLESAPMQEVLIQLLEQLIVPDEMQPELEALIAQLEEQTGQPALNKLLKQIASLINRIRSYQQQEKNDFEQFLQQITSRLQEMVQFLEDENQYLQDSRENGNQLGLAVAEEMQGLRDSVEGANDLSELQSMVYLRLDAISQHMLRHRQLEDERNEQADANLKQMQEKVKLLESETDQLKRVIDEKNKKALNDVLTGIPNRLAYEERIIEDVARWQRFNTPLSLIVWDVDFFKKINDSYGHKAGDKVLRTIAQLLNKRIRTTDFLARYGGEEFVMLLPGTIEEETLRLANELRSTVEQCGFHYHGEAVKITISCGISGFREGDTVDNVFERADAALYKAKQAGRNRCVVAACRSTD